MYQVEVVPGDEEVLYERVQKAAWDIATFRFGGAECFDTNREFVLEYGKTLVIRWRGLGLEIEGSSDLLFTLTKARSECRPGRRVTVYLQASKYSRIRGEAAPAISTPAPLYHVMR